MRGISFAGIVLVAFLIFEALHWGATGDVLVPGPVRSLWDKAYENKVEPAKKEMEQKYKDMQSTTPRPNNYGLGTPSTSEVRCSVTLCPAA